MREILRRRNLELRNVVEVLIESIELAQVPSELIPYKERILNVCKHCLREIDLQISFLLLDQQDILEDILSNTNQITEMVRIVSAVLAIPILRASPSDRLSLHTICWLHQEHSITSQYPPAFSSGSFAIYPFEFAPIYVIPTVEQNGLLYQPLLFHEFGHLLYKCHRPEMEDLVSDLRQDVIDLLRPVSQRNDRFAERQAKRRQRIADTWYNWAQELFCDAVGFEIGGPCFIYAFSSYLCSLSETDFRRQPPDLSNSSHPVSWLRVRFLTERARRRGFSELAAIIWNEWSMTATTMGLTEDYYGFYHESLSEPVIETLDRMLVEVHPREFIESEVTGITWGAANESPIKLLNWVWQVYTKHPEKYIAWESKQLKQSLEAFDNGNSGNEPESNRFFQSVLEHMRNTTDLEMSS